jgi:predicted nuclease of predicted toxin-antitoxin system
MRVLCDVHVAYRLVSRLRDIGVDATHVNRILDGSETTDTAIAAYVDETKCC